MRGEAPKPNVVVKRPPISFIIRKVLLEVAVHLIHDFIWVAVLGSGTKSSLSVPVTASTVFRNQLIMSQS
jgi:hypothetical protein